MNRFFSRAPGHRQRGLSLVELMVSMLVGLFLVGGILQLFIGTKQTYRFTQSLSRVQENGRFVHQLLARDLRMAGFSGCSSDLPVANVLNNPSAQWWTDFSNRKVEIIEGGDTLSGISNCAAPDSCSAGERIPGTDAIIILRGGDFLYELDGSHNPKSAPLKLKTLHKLKKGSIVMVCDNRQASILQLTNVNTSNKTIVHNPGESTPGNCTKSLGLPVECTATGTDYTYSEDSILVDFQPVAYYVGASSEDPSQRSLYRLQLTIDESSSTAAMESREIVSDVFDLQLSYGVDSDGDHQVNRYTSSVSGGDDILAVRADILLYSLADHLTETPMSLTYNGATFNASDRHYYQIVTTTVGLRNFLP